MNLKLRGKLLLLIISLLCIIAILVSFVVYNQILRMVIDNELNSYSKLGYELLNTEYKGDWKVEGDKLYKGNILINNNYEVVDKIKELTDSSITIFLKETRISTNVLTEEGTRAVGTKASEVVSNTVLREGKSYIGEADVVGKKFATIYIPIKDQSQQVVGMFFVGVDMDNIMGKVIPIINKIIILIGATILIGIVIAVIFINTITRNINKVIIAIKEIEKRNLSVDCDVKTKDELKTLSDSCNGMVANISKLIKNIQETSTQTESMSTTALNSSEEISATSEVISKSIQEIAKGIENQSQEMNTGLETTYKLAQKIEDMLYKLKSTVNATTEMKENNQSGIESIQSFEKSFQEYRDGAYNLAKNIYTLSDKSKSIEEIIESINNISNQTNLLALNAAIEAARAGDAGKGFGVVAEEIRKLAEQSAQSASRIQEIIGQIQDIIDITNKETKNSSSLLEESMGSLATTGKVFRSLENSINTVTNQIHMLSLDIDDVDKSKEIVVAAIESMSSVAQELSASTQQISASTQEQTASIEEINSFMQELKSMIDGLLDSVKIFKVKA